MLDFYVLYVILAILFLAICSYTDIKTRTVSNKLIFYFLIVSLLLKIFQAIINKSFSTLSISILSFLITFVICYVFWSLGVIAGGDLKILLVISIIFPQITIFSKTLPLFPIVLLLLGFIVLAPYVFIFSIIKLFSKNKIKYLCSIFSKAFFKNVLYLTLLLFFINSVAFIFKDINFYILFSSYFILIFILSYFLKKVTFKKRFIFLPILLALSITYTCIFNKHAFSEGGFLYIINIYTFLGLFLTILVINFLFSLIKVITNHILTEKKLVSQLKEGDVLVENYYFIKNKLTTKKPSFYQTVKLMLVNKYYYGLKVDSKKAGGLTTQDITFLKRMYKNNLLGKHISIKTTMPFTPALLIALILLLFI